MTDIIELTNDVSVATEQMHTALVAAFNINVTNVYSSFQSINQEIINVDASIQNAANSQDGLNNKVKESETFMDKLKNKATDLANKLVSMESVKMALDLSDDLTQTTSRLSAVNDGMQSQKQLQDMIYASAQRSRTGYMETMDTVTQLGTRAKDAFGSNIEAIQFSENLNKMFAIDGASQGDISAATEQMIQGLADGALSGDAMNSIFQTAPGMIQTMADSLGIPVEKMQEMANQGNLSADIVKGAMLGATDSINQGFQNVPMTFADISNQIKNAGVHAFEPILAKLSEFANSDQFQTMVNGLITGLSFLALVATSVFDIICSIGYFIGDNWSMIEPIIWGIVFGMGLYTAALLINQGAQIAHAVITGFSSLKSAAMAAITSGWTLATFAQTAAQYGLNAALAATPITGFLVILIAIIVIIYIVVAAINKFADTSISATGVIAGVFASLVTFLHNLFVFLYNIIADVANFLNNVFNDPVAAVRVLFWDMVNNVIGFVIKMAEAIEAVINNIPGVEVDITSKLGSIQSWIQERSKGIKDKAGWEEVAEKLEYKDYTESFKSGYEKGKQLEDKVKGMNPSDLLSNINVDELLGNSGASNTTSPTNSSMDNVAGNINSIADNTEEIKKSVDISSVDLKYLRDLAEQKFINRFTTAEIKVDMKNYNSIKNDQDLDGMTEVLRGKLVEQMNSAAEGVHA